MRLIMLGATIAVRDGTPFDVDVLPAPKTARGKAISRLVVDVPMILVALIFIAFGWRFALARPGCVCAGTRLRSRFLGPVGGKDRHASHPLRDHRSDLDRLRPGHTRYGLCLMIACSIGGIKIKDAVRDTANPVHPDVAGAARCDIVSGPDAVAAAQADAAVR